MSKAPQRPEPNIQYRMLLTNIRARYEVIQGLNPSENSDFATLETSAFHMRKSIEGIAFGCLVALENGLKAIPRDARGQWNADLIFARLAKRDQLVFPESFRREEPPAGSPAGVTHHIVKNEDVNLSLDDVRSIYRRSHKWVHEWNPYVENFGRDYGKFRTELLNDLPKIWNWLHSHMIGIGGRVFLGLLKDGNDEAVRVVSAETVNLDR
ncbi:MAG: hypothetical protein K2Q29_13330 [Sphingomonadales bacterium]|nr:hypothetical protein [Sphingomonadales bacterium]